MSDVVIRRHAEIFRMTPEQAKYLDRNIMFLIRRALNSYSEFPPDDVELKISAKVENDTLTVVSEIIENKK